MKQEEINVKKKMIGAAKEYASYSLGSATMNDPQKYTAFRDGQLSGFSIAMEEYRSQSYPPGIQELIAFVENIAKWELPATGKFWDEEKTRPISYETEYGSNGVRDYFKNKANKLLSDLKHLSLQDTQGWVKVEDGLPERRKGTEFSERVLVINDKGKMAFDTYYFKGEAWSDTSWVTHWQPLPSPPIQ